MYYSIEQFLIRRRIAGARAVGGVEIDDVAQEHLSVLQRVVPRQQRTDGDGAFANAADHHFTAGFDTLGDGDFAFARQQLHRTHFAQIHAHRVIGAADVVFVDIAAGISFGLGGLFAFGGGFRLFGFFAFDNVDAHFREHRHGVFDLLRGHFLGRQRGVQFVIGDVTALFRLCDELLDGGIG